MSFLATLGAEIKAISKLGGPRDVFQNIGSNGYYGNGNWGNMVSFGPGGTVLDGQGGRNFDPSKVCGDPLNNGVVAACVAAIAKALPDAPLILEQRTASGWVAVDDHPCLRVLRHPNPDHSDADVWGLTSAYKATRGQAFWLLLPDARGEIGEIHVWNPDRVTVLGSETEFISGYRVKRETGGEFPASREQIIHFRHMPDFQNPRLGWNPLGTGRTQIAGDNLAATYHSSILHNAGVVSLLISMKEGVAADKMTPDQFQTVLTQIRKANRERAGGVEGTNVPIDVHKLAYSPDEMSIDKLIEYYEGRICSVMGVSQRVAGLGADPTYNNLSEALNDFWERRIVPDRNADAATLNRQWLPLFGLDDGNWRFRFDFSNVPALQENKDELHKRVREDWESGITDKKQVRALLGYSGDEKGEAQFEGVFYPFPQRKQTPGSENVEDEPEVKMVDGNGMSHGGDGKFDGGAGGFDSAHFWTGPQLPEKESAAFQAGKGRALRRLLPYTKPGSNEAATVVLKMSGKEWSFEEGDKDSVGVNAPFNVPVAVLHTHDYDAAHSEADWADFLVNKGVHQSHVVTASKTYSLHKPERWEAEKHGLPEVKFEDGQDEYDAKAGAAEDVYLEQWGKTLQSLPGLGLPGWETRARESAAREMANKLGLVFRIGHR